jgi:hypothetical protein
MAEVDLSQMRMRFPGYINIPEESNDININNSVMQGHKIKVYKLCWHPNLPISNDHRCKILFDFL